ncbi:hypothetical protein EDB81DRAFT_789310 [Dactylonectria macrodidyma]|uniref:NADH dehydrogenase [ubiquinone] 1 beta subcomplex subunit 9 n=1 Tax=Dactylonectria macrodidyma TaxID=307937 RepID=A0A9P9FCC2_9HYPO|nr:hypothetical protein EDB81DRAFT_789310 [Dactylonectria macrodidyma]
MFTHCRVSKHQPACFTNLPLGNSPDQGNKTLNLARHGRHSPYSSTPSTTTHPADTVVRPPAGDYPRVNRSINSERRVFLDWPWPRTPALTPHTMSTRPAALSLYRRSLKLALDWAVHRHLWRGQALYIRSLFEANRNVTNPRQQRALLTETEKLLDSWKHPDPYTPPTAPGGSKFERNLPSPVLDPPPHAVNRH